MFISLVFGPHTPVITITREEGYGGDGIFRKMQLRRAYSYSRKNGQFCGFHSKVAFVVTTEVRESQ